MIWSTRIGLHEYFSRLGGSAERIFSGPIDQPLAWQAVASLLIGASALLILRWAARKIAAPSSIRLMPTAVMAAVQYSVAPAWVAALSLASVGAFRWADQPSDLLQLLALTAILLAVIRITMIALVRISSPSRVTGLTEKFLSWAVWITAILLMFDWLRPVIAAIDGVGIPVGNGRVSLLDAGRVVLVMLIFVAGASYLGALVERRMLTIDSLPIGVRVGAAKVTRVTLVVLAALAAFNLVGINLAALTVLGGALGVGLGFGLQRIASNFVSGFILLGDRSIRPGDVITVGQRFGVVRELRARYIVVRDRDGVDTLIPNENIITSEVINWSYADRHIRLKMPVQISYADDPRAALGHMVEAAMQHPRVEKEPPPAGRVMGFGENGIDLELRFWIRDPEDGVNNVRSDLYLAVWDAFKASGITIPFPQRDLNFPSGNPLSTRRDAV